MPLDWSAGSGHVMAGGKSLEWACFGPTPSADPASSTPAIVMLHEGLGCVALWRSFPEHLAAATGCPVFAYSRAGYGQSETITLPRPLDYMTREAKEVVPDILNAIGAAHYVLLGHSDGATISTEYAGRTDDFRVRGLVLMAPHFFTEKIGLREISKAKDVFDAGDLTEKMAKYHRDPEVAFRGWNDSWLHPDFEAWNVADALDFLRIPTLVIQGMDDQYGTIAQVDEVQTRSYAPVDVTLLDNCKHAPFLEQPQKTLATIAGFVARLCRIENEKVEIA